MAERVQGIVKFFLKDKGFGFARRKGFPDVFLHIVALRKAGIDGLKKGDKIEFEVVTVDDKKGREKAANIALQT